MNIRTIDQVLGELQTTRKKYLEFIRVPALSVGVYRLAAGAKDEQKPHHEDEVYYVIAGRAKFTCAGKVQDVRPGSILFVERGVEHRFVEIVEELILLVVFGPVEGTLAPAANNK
jgi:mannose-6-phosphate isomerase-like protein (cupin superfamily)